MLIKKKAGMIVFQVERDRPITPGWKWMLILPPAGGNIDLLLRWDIVSQVTKIKACEKSDILTYDLSINILSVFMVS